MLEDQFNLSNLIKGARKVQDMMEKTKSDLEKMELVGESGAGAITVVMSGRYEVKRISIEDEILQEPKEILEELIAAAVNDAIQKVEKETKAKMLDSTQLFANMAQTETPPGE